MQEHFTLRNKNKRLMTRILQTERKSDKIVGQNILIKIL